MSESLIAAALVILACVTGLIANGLLLYTLFKRVQISRYLHFLTITKAMTNFIELCNFFIAEVPNLLVGYDLYPEFAFRTFGAIAGVSLAGRYYQFFISLGTTCIAIFPLKPIPTPLHIISMILPPIFWAGFFSMRISATECSYQFSARNFAWFYNPAPCAQVLQKIMAKSVQTQIICSCLFNFITFSKLMIDTRRRTFIENAQLTKSLRKTKWRLIQCVAQDVLFMVDVLVYFNESEGHGLLFNFFFNTYIWNLAHMFDGIIIYSMMNKVKVATPSAGISVIYQFSVAESVFDNAIIGQPYISCERERIVIEVVTERLFTGKVFVKGDYANPQCTRTFRNGANINNENDRTNGDPFMGTVTRSREPYMEKEIGRVKANENNHRRVSEPDIAEAQIKAPRNNYSKQSNEASNSPDSWSSAGGATSDFQAAFGGSRGEEQIRATISEDHLKVFEKNNEKINRKTGEKEGSRLKSDTTVEPQIFEHHTTVKQRMSSFPSSINPDCPTTSTCEPCTCEEKRSRRATNSIRLEVPLDQCNAKRDRKLNPPSVIVSFIAVVSFHDSFITKLDKAYHIQCSYAETEKTVSTDIDVNMQQETELTKTVEPPNCEYLISDERGSPVRNSLVGELVSHKWICHGGLADRRRMLVHDCYVEDGSGQNFRVIDDHGCTLDRLMLQTPTYSSDGLTAQVDAYVFKFPDRSTVDFRCSITFCSLDDIECKTMTPPVCSGNHSMKRRKRRETSDSVAPSLSLHSNSLTVFDVDSKANGPDSSWSITTPQSLLSMEEIPTSFCISVASFGILISASTFFATISFAIIFSFIFIRFNSKLLYN